MADIRKVQQLTVTTADKPGMLAEVASVVAEQKVNIEAICAYGQKGKAIFYLVTSDNAKAKQALLAKGWQVKEEEVVMLDLENKPGALANVAAKLKAQNVNLKFCYGTTCTATCPARFILKADNNDAAIGAIK